jgi:hypothetical protein
MDRPVPEQGPFVVMLFMDLRISQPGEQACVSLDARIQYKRRENKQWPLVVARRWLPHVESH